VLIDEINAQNAEAGVTPLAAILDPGTSRLRPVAMAAATTALGMIPLFADAFFIAIAITIIFGLVVGSVLTMLIDAEWAAPLLWRSEFRNLLAGYLRLKKLTLSEAAATLSMARDSLNAGEYAVADEAVMKLVFKPSCTAYDCEFVALAEALGTVLVTEDKALRKAFPKRCRSLIEMVD